MAVPHFKLGEYSGFMKYLLFQSVLFLLAFGAFLALERGGGETRKRHADQEAAIRFIRELGGSVVHTDEAPEIFRKGIEKGFGKAFFVYLSKTKVNDDDLIKLKHLQPLAGLDLHNTLITDKGLVTMAGMGSIAHLRISGTKITDEGCKILANLKSLELLYASYTNFGDNALQVICENCPALHTLDAFQTKVTDKGVSNLAKLTKLRDVVLGKCNITNKGLVFVQKLPSLEILWISQTKVSPGIGKILRDTRSTKLRNVSLSGTKINDDDLNELKHIQTITHLDLENTAVTDKGVIQLVQLRKLVGLPLAGTKVTARARAVLEKSNPDIGFYSLPYVEKKK
jgi:internalin A